MTSLWSNAFGRKLGGTQQTLVPSPTGEICERGEKNCEAELLRQLLYGDVKFTPSKAPPGRIGGSIFPMRSRKRILSPYAAAGVLVPFLGRGWTLPVWTHPGKC